MAQVLRYTSVARTVSICTVTIRISFHVLLSRLVDLLTHLRSISAIIELYLFMPPTLKKLEGHIAFGLSVCLYVCVCVCVSVNF